MNEKVKAQVIKLEDFFFGKEINPVNYNHEITLENGAKVVSVQDEYLTTDADEDIYFHELSESEIFDLTLLMQDIE